MAQILSQDEVDALLQGIGESEDESGTEAAEEESVKKSAASLPQDVRFYDFTRTDMAVGGRLPGLEIIFNKFTRRLRNIFTSELGKSVDVGFNSMDMLLYEDLVKRIPLPSSIHLVSIEPMRGLGLFIIAARLAYSMVDLFFGGGGRRLVQLEGRDFTPIETNFMGKFVTKMMGGMEEAWQPVINLKGRYIRSEVNPYLLGATAMGDMMILTSYKVNMSTEVAGEILFAFPLSAIEQVRDSLKSPFPIPEGDSQGVRRRLATNILGVEVMAHVIVDMVDVKMREILNLHPGDLLQLSPRAMEQAELWIDGKPRFRGRAAQSRGTKVFVVSEKLMTSGQG